MRRLLAIHAFIIATCACLYLLTIVAAQETQEARLLEMGKPAERELAGGQTHTYQLQLAANQYLQLLAAEKGVDVALIVFAPDGKKLAEVNAPGGTQLGEALVILVIETAGVHRVEVRSPSNPSVAGRYQLQIKELRPATQADKDRIPAERAFQEAEQLKTLRNPESLRQAIVKYEEALRLWRQLSDQHEQGTTLHNMGFAYERLGEMQKALDLYAQALPLFRAVKHHSGEGFALENAGRIYKNQGQVSKALDYYIQALAAFRAARSPNREAIALYNIGVIHSESGENQKALDHYEQALKIHRTLGDRQGEANVLLGIGRHFDLVGEKQKALEYNQQALEINRARGDRFGEALTLNLVGQLYQSLGESQQAFDALRQALVLFRAVGDRRGEGVVINNLGVTYSSLGERQLALDSYNQALPILRALGDRRREATALHNIGMIYADQGERQRALENFAQALPLSRGVNDRRMEANLQDGTGLVYLALGEKQKALDHFGKSLALRRETEDRRGEASTLTNLGKAYAELGDQKQALDHYQQALTLRRAVKDRRGEAVTLYEVARVERNQGNLAEARAQVAAALDLAESLRTKVTAQELRSSYFASVQDYYSLDIDLLMQLHRRNPTGGFDALALETAERARARGLLETLAESHAKVRSGVDPALLAGERALQQQLNAREQARMQLLSGKHTPEQAAAAEKDLRELTTQYQELQAQIKTNSPRYAALTSPQPLKLAEIQKQVLDADTLLLQFALGPERSYLWAVSRDEVASFVLPKRDEIEAAARRFYESLIAFNEPSRTATREPQNAATASKTLDAARALSQMLLSHVATRLGTKRLLIVADGALQYVPFTALSKSATAYQPLMVEHEVVSVPSSSSLAALRRELMGRKAAAKALALFADPVFSAADPRLQRVRAQTAQKTEAQIASNETRELEQPLTRSAREVGVATDALRIPRLPGTRREAAAITALVPVAERKQALDFDASRATATSDELGQYRVIHFATHGLLNSHHPELSGIVLSLVDAEGKPQDGFLRLHEIYNLRLPAELVVLSACQTGLGQEIKGEGLVGLTRGFMYAGAARVMASLWKVDDRATAELMKHFYQGMVKDGLRPAAALRAAQVAMWKQQRWSEPYYWAAFVLQGEWK
jgi:CHAT domain-containing protein/tetratricopeptide (TPR) repeat protein